MIQWPQSLALIHLLDEAAGRELWREILLVHLGQSNLSLRRTVRQRFSLAHHERSEIANCEIDCCRFCSCRAVNRNKCSNKSLSLRPVHLAPHCCRDIWKALQTHVQPYQLRLIFYSPIFVCSDTIGIKDVLNPATLFICERHTLRPRG